MDFTRYCWLFRFSALFLCCAFAIPPSEAGDVNDFYISTEPTPSIIIQKEPRLFSTLDGGFIIAWEDHRLGEDAYFAQKFNSSGNLIGGNFPVVGNAGMAFLPDGTGMILGTETVPEMVWTIDPIFLVKGQILTSSGNPLQEFNIDSNDSNIFPPCPTGFWGLGVDLVATNTDFISGFNFGGAISLKKFNSDGELTFDSKNHLNLPETAMTFSLAANSRDQYVLLWFNADPDRLLSGIYATFFNSQDSIIAENVLVHAYKPRYYYFEEKTWLRAVAVADTAFEFFWIEVDSLILKNIIYSSTGQALNYVQKTDLPRPPGYQQKISNFAFTNSQYGAFGLLITVIGFVDIPTMPDDLEIYNNLLQWFTTNGDPLATHQLNNLEIPLVGENLARFSPDILGCPVESDDDVFLCRLQNFKWLDSLRINDDIQGANQILPKVSLMDSQNFFVSWKNEQGFRGRQIDIEGNLIGEEVALDGLEIHFFPLGKAVNFWKTERWEREKAGMTIYDTHTWQPVLRKTLAQGEPIFEFSSRGLPLSDSTFVVLVQEVSNLSLASYPLNGEKIKEKFVSKRAYRPSSMIPNDPRSFWVVWDGNAQLFSDELEPLSPISVLGLSDPVLYVEQGRFLKITTSTQPPGKFVTVLDTTGTQLQRFILVDDPHATNITLTLVDSTRFIATWTLNKEVYARTFTINGQPVTDFLTIHADVKAHRDWASACVNDDKALFVWADTRNWGQGYDVYGSVHELAEVTPVLMDNNRAGFPTDYYLAQNYPNPFNDVTMFRYDLSQPSSVTLEIYNIMGQKVRTLISEKRPAGSFTLHWDGKDEAGQLLGSGLYCYCLRTGDFVDVKRMVLLR